MKFGLRMVLYLVLVLLAGYFFGRFRAAYLATTGIAEARLEATGGDAPATNQVTLDTNALVAASGGVTHAPASGVMDPSATNAPAVPPASTAGTAVTPQPRQRSESVRSLALFVLFFLCLGGLAAWDVSQYLGNRAGRAVMADDWVERKDPEYEKAEEEWSKGNHLDAIALMREYLARNPREQHVAIRIAEIYEKDLGNYLAAALELQEVLTRRLPKERWGWTAIRLSNIYSGRLNQPDKALALLNRIVAEYPATAAAKKARARLGIPEPVEAEAPADSAPEPEADPAADSGLEDPVPPAPASPSSHLPKGFRPKK